jgi:protein ImuA
MSVSVQPPAIRRLREQTQSLEGTPLPARTVRSFGLETIGALLSGGGLALGAMHKVAGGDDTTIDGAGAANLSIGVAICLDLDYVHI